MHRSVTREESLKPWSEKALRSRFGNLLMEAVNIPYAGAAIARALLTVLVARVWSLLLVLCKSLILFVPHDRVF